MMPFFQASYKTCPKNLKKIAPLQVRNRRKYYINRKESCSEKRALSWASSRVQGSLSLEAAMCLSLFLFLCVCLIMPMKMMDRQRQIQAVVESVGEELSRYAYVEYCLESPDRGEVDATRAGGEELGALLAAGYASARILSRIDKDWIESVSFDGTSIGAGDMVHIVMKYRMRLPFSVLGIKSIPFEQVCSRRMWTGADERRLGQGENGGDMEEEIVYIGKNSSRYHRQRTCHYLYNTLEAVQASEVGNLRNQSGARYQPCRTCGSGSGIETVYVMPYGTSYHTSSACGSVIAYVQAVPLSQAEYLGPCSYCGKGG